MFIWTFSQRRNVLFALISSYHITILTSSRIWILAGVEIFCKKLYVLHNSFNEYFRMHFLFLIFLKMTACCICLKNALRTAIC